MLKLSIKLGMNFSQRQKTLKCLSSENFELQKCGHTEKSNYGLNLSIILMFLTIYGVGKLQCDRSTKTRLKFALIIGLKGDRKCQTCGSP